ncbi:MAG: 4-alpha-glucanotransferase [Gemmataceae bacterium]
MASPKLRASRAAGVLLHPTSLPGPFGIGDLGPAAYAWVDALARARQMWWQILPLGPTGPGDSPYQCYSAFAGNPNLVSPELLIRDGLLRPDDLHSPKFPPGPVDYGAAIPYKAALLDRAWENFRGGAAPALKAVFEDFNQRNADWLYDYAFFMALKDDQGGATWQDWPAPLRSRQPEALAMARARLGDLIGRRQFRQFLFFRQWDALHHHATSRGVKIMGDAPIFVSGDSADVWANPHLFLLDLDRKQRVDAGVPPDYFSPTGQLWGNPIYDWAEAKKSGYAWWIARLRSTLAQVEVVRLDHFRGFAAAWHIPHGAKTAIGGQWVPGPGADLFHKLRQHLGGLPLIAEDLGLITPDVEALRDEFRLPGMCVLQFAFSDPHNRYLPHNYTVNSVAYTGTHDNDTTRGWFARLGESERDFVRRYLGRDGSDIAWDFIRLAWSSTADLAIAPLQDVLNLGGEARMNTPGQREGNWRWRLPDGVLTDGVWARLAELTELYSRS